MRVLVVEDHPDIRRAMSKLLASQGYEVTLAETVADGLRRLDANTHLVLDLQLPDGLGTTILQHIRDQHLDVHVAITTGTSDPDILHEARSLEPDLLLAKPIQIETLFNWLRV